MVQIGLMSWLTIGCCRHKTRAHITRLVKDTSEKLKQASEADHRVEVSVCIYILITLLHYIRDCFNWNYFVLSCLVRSISVLFSRFAQATMKIEI